MLAERSSFVWGGVASTILVLFCFSRPPAFLSYFFAPQTCRSGLDGNSHCADSSGAGSTGPPLAAPPKELGCESKCLALQPNFGNLLRRQNTEFSPNGDWLVGIHYSYIVYAGARRPSPGPNDDGVDRRHVPMDTGFHRAVQSIAHPTSKAQGRRRIGKRNAVTNALHLPLDN